MQLRRTAAIGLTTLVVLAGGCARQVSDVPDDERPVPDGLPLIEPVSPPATHVDRPNEPPAQEDGVPEDDPVGTLDGEEGGIGEG